MNVPRLASGRIAPLAHETADAFGVGRHEGPEMIARALLRAAKREPVGQTIPAPVAKWLTSVAEELGGYIYAEIIDVGLCAERTADAAVARLPRFAALSMLAVLAPNEALPGGRPSEIGRACTARLHGHLRSLCGEVLRGWEGTVLKNSSRGSPDDIENDEDAT